MMLTALAGAALCFVLHAPPTTPAHPAVRVAAVAMVAEPAAMKLKEIKVELDGLGVAWKGVYFERDDLSHALMNARGLGHLADAAPAAEPPAAAAASGAAASGAALDVQENAEEAVPLEEMKAELDYMGVVWRGVYLERDDLAHALMTARARGHAHSGSAPGHHADAVPAADAVHLADAVPAAAAHSPALDVTEEAEEVVQLEAVLYEEAVLHDSDEDTEEAYWRARAALFSTSGALSPGRVGEVDAAQCELEMADARTPLLLDVFATW